MDSTFISMQQCGDQQLAEQTFEQALFDRTLDNMSLQDVVVCAVNSATNDLRRTKGQGAPGRSRFISDESFFGAIGEAPDIESFDVEEESKAPPQTTQINTCEEPRVVPPATLLGIPMDDDESALLGGPSQCPPFDFELFDQPTYQCFAPAASDDEPMELLLNEESKFSNLDFEGAQFALPRIENNEEMMVEAGEDPPPEEEPARKSSLVMELFAELSQQARSSAPEKTAPNTPTSTDLNLLSPVTTKTPNLEKISANGALNSPPPKQASYLAEQVAVSESG